MKVDSAIACTCFLSTAFACQAGHPDAKPVSLVVPGQPVLRGDPLEVRVVGLEPGSGVTVTAERTWGRRPPAVYRGSARFTANEQGEVNLATMAPEEASWTGVDSFGFLWSMQATDDAVPEGRSSTVIKISVDIDGDKEADASAEFQSIRSRDDLVRTPLGNQHPGAFLLRPPGDEPLPAIIVLGGSEGGDSTANNVGAKLASRGYAVVGLPYYSPAYWGQEPQFPQLPRGFHNIPVDRLEQVRDWLIARDDVMGDRIGLYGVSKGAEFALLGASLIDGFSAVVAYVPSDVVWEAWGPGTTEGQSSCFSWRGEPLPFVPYKGMSAEIAKYQTGEPVRIRTPHDAGRNEYPDRVDLARIRVEDIDEPVFIVGGDADDTWDSGGMSRNILATRDRAGLTTVAIVDEQAGHGLSGDGCTPTSAANGRVQARAFPAMVSFFDEHLKDAKPDARVPISFEGLQ